MRLLIITQKVDLDDPVLGFFHGWVEKLSREFESITVICLGKGRYDLPSNVKVLSLGKENEESKIKYVLNFYRYILQERKNYDSVFIHMNQEYVLLGGLFWKMLGKKIFFWRNHPKGSLLTRIAVWLSNKVFYTSPASFTAKFEKAIEMPVGIDVEKFKTQNARPTESFGQAKRKKNSILFLGRISRIKNVHLILEAARILWDKNVEFTLDVVGDPVNPEDSEYKKKLIAENKDLIGSGHINFMIGVPNYKTSEIYASHEIYVNLTLSGSMDKTILEAASCGCLPVVANPYFKPVFDQNMIVLEDAKDIAQKLEFWMKSEEGIINEWRERLRNYVKNNHSLDILIEKLVKIIKQ